MYSDKEIKKTLLFYGDQFKDFYEELKAEVNADMQEIFLVEEAIKRHKRDLALNKPSSFPLIDSIKCGERSLDLLRTDLRLTKDKIKLLSKALEDLTGFHTEYEKGNVKLKRDIYETIDAYMFRLGHREIMEEVFS